MAWLPCQWKNGGMWIALILSLCVSYSHAVCNIEDITAQSNGEYSPLVIFNSPYVAVGEEVWVLCNPGYIGCDKLTCTDDGTFSPSAPSCIDVNECDVTDTEEYSFSSSSNPDNECGEPATPPVNNCHENAKCRNTRGSFYCQCDGDYNGDGVNTCEYDPPVCELMDAPENGYVVYKTTKKTKFDCNEGYKLHGSRSMTCTRDSGWTGWYPECIRNVCEDPVAPNNGFKIGDRLSERVTFGCNPGFTLEGSDSRVCTERHEWSGWQPLCKPAKTLHDIAGDLRRDFIDKFELFTDSSMARSAMGRLSLGKNKVGLDLVFAFDKSSSVGMRNFEKGLNFTKSLIDEFGVDYDSPGGTRYAIMSFASVATVEFNYNDGVETKEKVFAELDAMKNTLGGGTAMQEALALVVTDIIPQMRNGSKKALFIVTDGHANTEDPVAIARDLRVNRDFEIFAIGIGNDVDKNQIREVASVPYTSHVFLINSFDDLTILTEIIAEKRTDYERCGIAGDWEIDADETSKTNTNAWPWLAQIHLQGKNLYCEGALICHQWVMVSAKCLAEDQEFGEPEIIPKEQLIVKVGSHKVFEVEGCEQNATVDEIHVPMDSNNDTLESDIALLKLDHPFQLVNCIRTICLPTKGDKFNFIPGAHTTMRRCYQAGWAKESTWETPQAKGFPYFTPRQVEMPLVGDHHCEEKTGEELSEKTMCAGDRTKTDPDCYSHAGNPLVCRRDDDSWSLMGVLYDASRCHLTYPDVTGFSFYAKVYSFIDWINDVTCNCHDKHVVKPLGGFKTKSESKVNSGTRSGCVTEEPVQHVTEEPVQPVTTEELVQPNIQ